MATGGFKPNPTTDFLEEWKAKREKMRAKMLGDIAAATGSAPLGTVQTNKSAPNIESNNHGHPAAAGGNPPGSPPCTPITRSFSSPALKKPAEDSDPVPAATPGGHPKKCHPSPPVEKTPCPSVESSPSAGADGDPTEESPSPGKGKDKKCAGPSARKGKGQIEKRKLREKRRSTGVVSIPSNECLDELEDDDGGERERKMEQQLVQANTVKNEGMSPPDLDPPGPPAHLLQETPRPGTGRIKSSPGAGSAEEDAGGSARQPRETSAYGSLERRVEELEKELAGELQENDRLMKAHEDKDDLIGKLKEEIDLLNRDLDDIEDENEQLKQENKTLLKVVGQLTR